MSLAFIVAVSQIVATIVVAVALIVSVWQTQQMRLQVETDRRGQLSQATIEVLKHITSPEVKAAEAVVIELGDTSSEFWSPNERESLTTWCNAFDVAGMFVRNGLADEKIIVDNWGANIRRHYDLAGPHVTDARTRFGTDFYWDDLEWLATRPSIQVKQPRTRIRE